MPNHYTTTNTQVSQEEWLPVPNWHGYYISTEGVVITYRSGFPKVLKQNTISGYKYVSMRDRCNGRPTKRTVAVHRLVLETFVGECPDGMECCHYDGDKSNNQLTNLRWDTHKANMADTRRINQNRRPVKVKRTHIDWVLRGEDHKLSKLTESDVIEIKTHLSNKETYKSIAIKFKVSTYAVQRIASGQGWRHIK